MNNDFILIANFLHFKKIIAFLKKKSKYQIILVDGGCRFLKYLKLNHYDDIFKNVIAAVGDFDSFDVCDSDLEKIDIQIKKDQLYTDLEYAIDYVKTHYNFKHIYCFAEGERADFQITNCLLIMKHNITLFTDNSCAFKWMPEVFLNSETYSSWKYVALYSLNKKQRVCLKNFKYSRNLIFDSFQTTAISNEFLKNKKATFSSNTKDGLLAILSIKIN